MSINLRKSSKDYVVMFEDWMHRFPAPGDTILLVKTNPFKTEMSSMEFVGINIVSCVRLKDKSKPLFETVNPTLSDDILLGATQEFIEEVAEPLESRKIQDGTFLKRVALHSHEIYHTNNIVIDIWDGDTVISETWERFYSFVYRMDSETMRTLESANIKVADEEWIRYLPFVR